MYTVSQWLGSLAQPTLKQFSFTGWRTRASSLTVYICMYVCMYICVPFEQTPLDAVDHTRRRCCELIWSSGRPVHTAAYLYIRSPVYCLFISNFDCNSGSCSRKPNPNWYKLPSVAATAVYIVLVVCSSFADQIFWTEMCHHIPR